MIFDLQGIAWVGEARRSRDDNKNNGYIRQQNLGHGQRLLRIWERKVSWKIFGQNAKLRCLYSEEDLL